MKQALQLDWLALAKQYETTTIAGMIPQTLPASVVQNPQCFEVCVAYSREHIVCNQVQPATFTIQSIAKFIVLFYILDTYGSNRFFKKVDLAPTTIAYNETAASLFIVNQKIVNPFINAGALTLVSMIEGQTVSQKVQQLQQFIQQTFAITTTVDSDIYAYERTHSQTNEAICHTLHSLHFLEDSVATTLDTYLQLCALRMTAQDLAKMSYIFQEMRTEAAQLTEQALLACGLYCASPLTIKQQPIAAKSGVAGGIIAYSALPDSGNFDKIGLGIYSPLLNEEGNSAKGYQFLQHFFSQHY